MSAVAENLDCSICIYFGDKFKDALQKVGTKGLNSLIKFSKDREDKFYEYLETTNDVVNVHKSCRRLYGNPVKVSIAAKRKNSFASPPTASKLKFAPQITEFDYKKNCLICNKEINFHNLKRYPVHSVTKLEFAQELCNRIEQLDIQTDDTIALKNRLLHDNLVLC